MHIRDHAGIGGRLHPELFSDVDPAEYQRDYFEKWYGIPYQGVWVYPEISRGG